MREYENLSLRKIKKIHSNVRLSSVAGQLVLLEYLDSGITTHIAIRLVKCNHFGQAELEIHLEFRNGVWLPFYYFNEISGNEIHLYHRIGNELLVNHGAGVWLIEMVGLFELNLLAEGFIEELNGNLYQSLLARMAGAA